MYNHTSNPELKNVTLSGNRSASGGGMSNYASNPVLTNVTLSGNLGSNGGGAIFNDGSSPVLTNVTVSGNQSSPWTGGMYSANSSNPVIYDSIFWGNVSPEIVNVLGATVMLNDSILKGGCPVDPSYTCTHVINKNPNLGALISNGGFTKMRALQPGSAAIDTGNNATCAPKDQRGVKRPQGPRCDMGAYEYRP
jgi:hypothetical protein